MYLLKKNINNLLIKKGNKMENAIKKINKSQIKTLFVVDKNKKLLGSITDGDIRRTIIKKKNLNINVENVMNKKFKFFYKNKNDLDNYENLFKQKVFGIPVLEKSKKIIFFLIKKNELKKNFKNTIFLMAGGKGKRLYPLTKNTPKPMLKIKDVPIIERVIVNFKEQGFTNFVISINYLEKKIKKYLKNGERLNVKVEYIEEKNF